MPKTLKYIAVPAEKLAPSPRGLFVGTSGWAYPTWKPGFYPPAVPSRAFLTWYAAHLTAVEVNFTFRKLPTAVQLQNWLQSAPPGFRFSFKAPQRITHFARLRNCADQIRELAGVLEPAFLAGKCGPVLFQLPPNFQSNASVLETFLQAATPLTANLPLAFEFRHASWFAPETYEILRAHNVGLCIADTDDLTTPEVHTASFSCYRLRRDGGYTDAELATLAAQFTATASHRETFVFFRHQDEPTGALNALTLLALASGHSSNKARLSSESKHV